MDNYKTGDVKQLAFSLFKVMSPEQRMEFLSLVNQSLRDNIGFSESNNSVPLSIFSNSLSCFETIIIHLIDNQHCTFKHASMSTGRKVSTIYSTYYSAKKKYNGKLTVDVNATLIPLAILVSRKYSVLECITAYLHDEQNLKLTEIAQKLRRKYSTIKTVYQRYKKKLGELRVSNEE